MAHHMTERSPCNYSPNMPLQNRVDPSGRLFANPSKAATLMGNRGCLHDGNKNVVRERTSLKRWISCTLEPRFDDRTPMQRGWYTELFFLDEATALAAGHRPCPQCRREAYKRFRAAWLAAGLSETVSAVVMDKALDAERRGAQRTTVKPASLPDGAMVRQPGDGSFYLVYRGRHFPWSFSGYGPASTSTGESSSLELVTLPAMLKILTAGYVPTIHPSVVRSY